MANKIDEMLAMYGLSKNDSILPLLDFLSEEESRLYCWKLLRTYPDLKKENWLIGIEGGDYIYSFENNYILITDDIWSFNLIGKPAVLELLAKKIKAIKLSEL
ncbi:hypothetical protein [Pedobacter punctiformis]|uniref:Uncharacterized protein n=1 Tax=Pedobacter punctiformis TaxID=3004097 RepID=A0ABT4LDE7_9SPHI|nr:hypothetical protein [Pedobacter sp. HCMS5-2]MCZ4245918.1 hypothetical protein [Pedobacter sp. HCMS5-2]